MDHEFNRELIDELRWRGVIIERGGGKAEQVELDKVEHCFRQARLAGLEVVRSHPRILPALHCTTSANALKLEGYQAKIVPKGTAFCAKSQLLLSTMPPYRQPQPGVLVSATKDVS